MESSTVMAPAPPAHRRSMKEFSADAATETSDMTTTVTMAPRVSAMPSCGDHLLTARRMAPRIPTALATRPIRKAHAMRTICGTRFNWYTRSRTLSSWLHNGKHRIGTGKTQQRRFGEFHHPMKAFHAVTTRRRITRTRCSRVAPSAASAPSALSAPPVSASSLPTPAP